MTIQMNTQGIGMTSQRTRDRLIARLRENGIVDERVLEVMRSTPRHLFMDEAMASRAYEDTALPIGFGQTISQPYIVARMTQALLQHGTPARVLEIGTGSGYQTAILSQLVTQVFSIERVGALLSAARQRLSSLGFNNIHFRLGDGHEGWSKYAPFDAILVTAAPEEIPAGLMTQLKEGGALVIPVGANQDQRLRRLIRTGDDFSEETLELVSFVPLVKGKL